MYSGNNRRLPGASRLEELGLDWTNLYAERTSIATLMNASLASERDDW